MPSNKMVNLLLAFILLFASALTTKDTAAGVADLSPEEILQSEEEIFGQSFKNKYHTRAENYDYVHALSLETNLRVDSPATLYYILPQLSVEYSVNLVMPFSPIGVAFLDYMLVVKDLILNKEFEKDNYSKLIIPFMKAFKNILATVKPTSVQKEDGHYLAYSYESESINAFKKTVATLFQDKGLQNESENCYALRKSFETLNPLSLHLNSEDEQWKNSNIETTIFKLDTFEGEDGNSSIVLAPADVVDVISTLLKIGADTIKYDVPVNQASFYSQLKKASEHIYTLLLTTVSSDLLLEAKKFLDAFSSLSQNAQINYFSKTNKLKIFIFEGKSKEVFQEKSAKFLEYLTDADVGDDQPLKDLIGVLSFSLESVINSIKDTVPQSLDGNYKDYDFSGVYFQRIIKNQDLDKESWTTLKEIHSSVHNQESFFRLNKSSEISHDLLNFFYYVVRLFEEYEQSAKLRAQFFELYDVTKSFITNSVPQSKTSPQLVVIGYYQYQRVPCFALQHHLSEFVGLLDELIFIDSKDKSTKKIFLSAVNSADKILNKFGRRITYTKGNCFEIFHGLEENEDGFLAQFLGTDSDIPTTAFGNEIITGEQDYPENLDIKEEITEMDKLANEKPVLVEEKSIDEINDSGDDQNDSELPQDENHSLLNRKQKKESRNKNLMESEIIDDDLEEENKSQRVHSQRDIELNQLDNDLPLLKSHSTPAFSKKPEKIVRRIVIIEVLDCDECLNDSNLALFVESLKNPFSKI